MVALAALRCWKTLAVAVVALALNVSQVAPVFIGHQAAARPGSPTLTIAHLNLQSRIGDLPAMDQWLATRPADIVVFLHTAGGHGQAPRERRGRVPHDLSAGGRTPIPSRGRLGTIPVPRR